MIQKTAGFAALTLVLSAGLTMMASTRSLADTDPAAPLPAAVIAPTPPDLDALVDENPDFDGLEFTVPAGIDRRPAVLPATATDDDAAFPSEDSD